MKINAAVSFLRTLLPAALMAVAAAPPFAVAQDAPGGQAAKLGVAVAEHFPAGSIKSTDSADLALGEVGTERGRIEQRYAEAEQVCYEKFFATACLDRAKEERRAALALIRPVEVEANAFKRRAKVEERDKALAEKRAEEQAQAAQHAKQQQEQEAAAARKAAAAGQPPPAKTAAGGVDREAEHAAKLKRIEQEEAANAPKRAANIAAHEKKVKEAEKRQQEVAAKKAEKERERAAKEAAEAEKKAAEAAAKNATPAKQ